MYSSLKQSLSFGVSDYIFIPYFVCPVMQSTSDEVNFLNFPTHKKLGFLRMAQKIAVHLICKCLYEKYCKI